MSLESAILAGLAHDPTPRDHEIAGIAAKRLRKEGVDLDELAGISLIFTLGSAFQEAAKVLVRRERRKEKVETQNSIYVLGTRRG